MRATPLLMERPGGRRGRVGPVARAAAPVASRARGGGQSRQPARDPPPARAAGPHGGRLRRRPGGRRGGRGGAAGPRADGRPDAGDGRLRGHRGDPRARGGAAGRPAAAHRGPHRVRDEGRPRALPGRGHGRLPDQADPARPARRRPGALGRGGASSGRRRHARPGARRGGGAGVRRGRPAAAGRAARHLPRGRARATSRRSGTPWPARTRRR